MIKRKLSLLVVVSFLAVALVMVATVWGGSGDDPGPHDIEVDGVFHGDPYDDLGPDKDFYFKIGEDPGRGALWARTYGDVLYMAMVVSPTVNDTVFGQISKPNDPGDYDYLRSAGWLGTSNERSAHHLITSDNMQFTLACDGQSWTWMQDFVYGSDFKYYSDPTGPDGDGGTTPGGAQDQFASSGSWNFTYVSTPTEFGAHWDYTVGNSRTSADDWISVNELHLGVTETVTDEIGWGDTWWNTPNQWEWAMVYEMGIVITKCNGAQPVLRVDAAHMSPVKDDDDTITIEFYDWGDLPYDPDGKDPAGTDDFQPDWAQYPTKKAQDGPRHLLIPTGPVLGDIVDAEVDGIPEGQALGDDIDPGSVIPPVSVPDDEDGVWPTGPNAELRRGRVFTLTITGTLGAMLDAWIDFGNGITVDGNLDPWDRIADHLELTTIPQELTFTVPSTMPVPATTYGRFRLSFTGVPTPGGEAPDGEVEDYVFYTYPPLAAFMGPIKATAFTNAVLVEWESLSELNTIGYHVERSLSPEGPWTQLNGSMIQSQQMGSVMGASYDFVDTDVEQGVVYYYRLVSMNNGGVPTYYDPIKVTVPVIGEPYEPYVPPTPASIHRVFLPMIGK